MHVCIELQKSIILIVYNPIYGYVACVAGSSLSNEPRDVAKESTLGGGCRLVLTNFSYTNLTKSLKHFSPKKNVVDGGGGWGGGGGYLKKFSGLTLAKLKIFPRQT